MSETATGPDAAPQDQAAESEPKVESIDWKSKAREWEKRAKDNKSAADELTRLREEQKSAEQKAADREKAALDRATAAEAKAIRREVALEYGLSKDDAALLDDLGDEDAMKRLAERLADREKDKRKKNPVPREGGNPRPPADADREFVRNLFGSGT